MPLRISTATQNVLADAAVDLLDAGPAAGTIKIYSGAQPASANDAATGTLLATVVLADPAFGAAASGTATGTDPASVNASATGTAGWARFADSTGATVMDSDVGVLTSVTGTAASDTLTTSGAHGLAVGQVVVMKAGIAGIAAGAYVVIAVPTSTTFKIAPHGSATAVDITADGSASYSTAAVTLSTTSLTATYAVDITSLTVTMPAA